MGALDPQLFVVIEEGGSPAHCRPIGVNNLLAAASFFRDKGRPFEHRYVLLHRGKTHGVLAGQIRNRLLVPDRAPEDVAAGRISQGAEDAVDLVFRQSFIYNHMVVD